jgi:hypothetical protein
MNFFNYTLTEADKAYCLKHAQGMADGFSTYSFKNDTKQSLDVYYIGKVGEFAVYKYLRALEKDDAIKIVHVPFREKYDKLNFNDDFIIEKNGIRQQIEVRTKGRNVEPKLEYECCSDCIKPHFLYIFVSFNRQTDTASVLGLADWENFSKHAVVTKKGSNNDNFTNKVNEFNIKIQYLTPLNEYFV